VVLGLGGCLSLLDADFDGAYLAGDGTGAAVGGSGVGGETCEPGATAACYEGPPGTDGQPMCKAGTRTCLPDGSMGTCDGQVLPGVECGTDEIDENCDGRTGAHAWSRRVGGWGVQRSYGSALAADGSVVLTGYSHGELIFGEDSTDTAAGIFAVKLGADGGLAWAKSFGPEGGTGTSIATAGDSAVLTALIVGPTDFGGGELTPGSTPGDHSVVVKLGSDGAHIWSRYMGDGVDPTNAKAVGTDAAGNSVIGGYFLGALGWPVGSAIDAGNESHMFLALLDADGGPVWARDYGPHADVWHVAFDSEGNILVTGVIPEFFADLGGGELGDGDPNSFVAKFDAAGNHLWSRALGLTNKFWGRGLAVLPGDAIAIAFPFSSTLNLPEGITLESKGIFDVGVVKLAPEGDIVWARGFGGPTKDTPWDLAATEDGGVVVAGSFSRTFDVDPGVCPGVAIVDPADPLDPKQFDAFLLKLDPDGDPMWLHSFGNSTEMPIDYGWFADIFYTVDVDGNGDVVATGVYDGYVDFGGGLLKGNAQGDMVVARYTK
jgi:hypothetical protein